MRCVILVQLRDASFVQVLQLTEHALPDDLKRLFYMPPSTGASAGAESKSDSILPHEIELGAEIGKGSFGHVHKATWKGREIVVKRVPLPLTVEDEVCISLFISDACFRQSLMSTVMEAAFAKRLNNLPNVGTVM